MITGLKRLVPIVIQQKARDVSEADTVTLVKDLFSDVMGYDKYAELTSEHAIKGTFCDLAIKLEGAKGPSKVSILVEVKSAGTELDERHVKQAVDYAANDGVQWVVLTNASVWRLYHVRLTKQIEKKLIFEVDLTTLDLKKEDDRLEHVHALCKEGFLKGALTELKDHKEAVNRFTVAALLLNNDSVISALRRELKKLADIAVAEEDVLKLLRDEVVKRDALEGPDAEAAAKLVNRLEAAAQRAAKSKRSGADALPESGVVEKPVESQPDATVAAAAEQAKSETA